MDEAKHTESWCVMLPRDKHRYISNRKTEREMWTTDGGGGDGGWTSNGLNLRKTHRPSKLWLEIMICAYVM